jgi:hypothetical protein
MSDQGSLFDADDFQQQGPATSKSGYKWARPHDRPIGPDPKMASEQLRLTPFQKPPTPSPFAKSGVGKYVNRNANGVQFNKPAVTHAVDNVTRGLANAQYFRHAGMGAALRHTFGLKQIPSHVNDFLNARHNATIQGHDPDPISAQLGD